MKILGSGSHFRREMSSVTKSSIYSYPFLFAYLLLCDFNKYLLKVQPVDEYIELLIRNGTDWEKIYNGPLKTLYVGGEPSSSNPQWSNYWMESMSLPLRVPRVFNGFEPWWWYSWTAHNVKKKVNRLSVGVQTLIMIYWKRLVINPIQRKQQSVPSKTKTSWIREYEYWLDFQTSNRRADFEESSKWRWI